MSTSLIAQTRPSANFKTIASLKPGAHGLAPLTARVTTMPVPQGQENMTKLVAPPANTTVQLGAPAQPNTPLPVEPAQPALSALPVNMTTP